MKQFGGKLAACQICEGRCNMKMKEETRDGSKHGEAGQVGVNLDAACWVRVGWALKQKKNRNSAFYFFLFFKKTSAETCVAYESLDQMNLTPEVAHKDLKTVCFQ